MTLRVHIERLVLEARALPAARVPAFRAALEAALARGSGEAPPPRGDAARDLAERTAREIRHRARLP